MLRMNLYSLGPTLREKQSIVIYLLLSKTHRFRIMYELSFFKYKRASQE